MKTLQIALLLSVIGMFMTVVLNQKDTTRKVVLTGYNVELRINECEGCSIGDTIQVATPYGIKEAIIK